MVERVAIARLPLVCVTVFTQYTVAFPAYYCYAENKL